MGQGQGTGTGHDHGEVQGSNPSITSTMTPVGAFIDPMRSVTGSTTLSAVESGPGSGVNQVQGFGTGMGTDIESGQKQGYTDKELSVQSLGTFTKSLNTSILNIIHHTLPYSTPFDLFQLIPFN